MSKLNVLKGKKNHTPTDIYYHLCPCCGRAVPAVANELFCSNDGTKLLTSCPQCNTRITSPFSHFCHQCGQSFKTFQM